MSNLVSPGVQVSIINNASAPQVAAGTVPTVFIATQSNKLLSDGVTIAPGTTSANAGKVYTITSQRELLQTFGNPFFNVITGTVQQGDEVNEVGLHAAWSYLGLANSINVIRADLDVSQLMETEVAPTSPPANGTYWFDYTNSSFGVFRANGSPIAGLAWNQLAVLTPTADQIDGSYVPLDTFGAAGSVAVVINPLTNEIELFEKISTSWYLIGSPAWLAARPTSLMGSVAIPGAVDGTGTLDINGSPVVIPAPSPPAPLLTSANFALLAGATVTNTGSSVITGDVGAVSSITPGGWTVTGTVHTPNDAATVQALSDANSAYSTLSALTGTDLTGQDLGTLTLTPGVYTYSSSAALTGTLTLDFQHLSNQQIVIITDSTLTTASASVVNVINSNATNQVFFVVGSSATLGTSTQFAGNIIAQASITLGASVAIANGSMIALSGSVTDAGAITSAIPAILPSTTLADLIAAIIAADIPGITASAGGLGNEQLVITNTDGLNIVISGTPAVLTALGTPAITTYGYTLTPFTASPTPPDGSRHDGGDIWIKTTNPNFGANFVVKKYNSSVAQWQVVAAPLYANDVAAEAALGLTLNEIYVEYNTLGTLTQPEASFVIRQLSSLLPGNVTEVSSYVSPLSGSTFTIQTRESAGANIGTLSNLVTVTITGTLTLAQLVTAINAAIAVDGTMPHVVASAVAGKLVITSTNGSAVDLEDGTNTPLASLGVQTGIFAPNWIDLVYTASVNAPTAAPAEGALWFNPTLVVDIMVDNGNQWVGYLNEYPLTDPNGPQVTSAMPTTQSTGAPLQNYDLWIQSDNVVGYPAIYRYLYGNWTLVDNTDHTTPMGVVFGDVRANSGPLQGSDAVAAGWINTGNVNSTAEVDLLVSNFVDPVDEQILNPQIFPAGILLFNTEISTDNIKVWNGSYFSGITSYVVGATTFTVNNWLNTTPGRWVTASGNDINGVVLNGRFAQREMIVKALAAQIVDNQDVRSEALYFNLLACPGYIEVLADLVGLNIDRQETAFIITDVPATLTPDATSINNWATDAATVATDGRLGRITAYDYAAMYYPWGLGTNVDGNSVAIPSSTIALRTYGYNDRVGYPWTPPAGTRRGIVSNASSVGYIDINTMEYKPTNVNQGQRDALYLNNINPILFKVGSGLIIRGDKTLAADQTSLTTRVNVARTVVYLRYILPQLFEKFLFELNTIATRAAAADLGNKFLVGLVGQGALTDFAVVCDTSNNTPDTIAANELFIDIAVVPTFAIDFIYIPVSLQIALNR